MRRSPRPRRSDARPGWPTRLVDLVVADRAAAGRSAGRSGVTALTTSPAVERARRPPPWRRCPSPARRPAAGRGPAPRPPAAAARGPPVSRAPARAAPAPGTSSRSMTASTARAAAAASGWPPKVVAWSPGSKAAATSRRAQQAPMGTPLPSALAMVTTSGATPKCWKPNHAPVRPRPGLHLVDHEQEAALVAQARGRPGSTRRSAGLTPPSPCTGSSSTAATVGSMAASSASRSFQATWRKPSGSGWNASCLAGWPVACSVASVRPWNEP